LPPIKILPRTKCTIISTKKLRVLEREVTSGALRESDRSDRQSHAWSGDLRKQLRSLRNTL
jgi:hypothetical protein